MSNDSGPSKMSQGVNTGVLPVSSPPPQIKSATITDSHYSRVLFPVVWRNQWHSNLPPSGMLIIDKTFPLSLLGPVPGKKVLNVTVRPFPIIELPGCV